MLGDVISLLEGGEGWLSLSLFVFGVPFHIRSIEVSFCGALFFVGFLQQSLFAQLAPPPSATFDTGETISVADQQGICH